MRREGRKRKQTSALSANNETTIDMEYTQNIQDCANQDDADLLLEIHPLFVPYLLIHLSNCLH